jgi:membrane protease YdiL (CAAX protease family)
MPVGSKSFTSNTAAAPVADGADLHPGALNLVPRKWVVWGEILLVLLLLELVFWTPRSLVHTFLMVALLGSALWFGFRGRNREELGFLWPSRGGTVLILAIGCGVALAIPLLFFLSGHPVPANPDWPKVKNLWPYVAWALGQQFLLQSFFYLRFQSLLGARAAVLVSSVLFALLHLPNLPLTAMTVLGGLFFTEMFRAYRSLYPLGIAHALMGIAIAYSFPDSLMHHMRVGLSYWQFR